MLIHSAPELGREGEPDQLLDGGVIKAAARPHGRSDQLPSGRWGIRELKRTHGQTHEIDREAKCFPIEIGGPVRQGVPETLEQAGSRHSATCR